MRGVTEPHAHVMTTRRSSVTPAQIVLGFIFGLVGIGFILAALGLFAFISGLTQDPIEHIDE